MTPEPNLGAITLDGSETETREVTRKMVETKNDEMTNGLTVRTSET